jgi:integrase/recombinase XerD
VRYIIGNDVVLSQAPVGPLAAYLESFAESLVQQGYTQHYIHRHILLAACFSRWLLKTGAPLHCVMSEHLTRYFRHRHRQRRPNMGDRPALDHLMVFLRREGVISDESNAARQPVPAELCVREYEQYLRDARGLAEVTIRNYALYIRRFLEDRYGVGPLALSHLRANDILRFLLRQAPGRYKKRTKILTTALRSFLRYTRARGEIEHDLAAAVPTVPNWSMTSIPRGIATDQVRQLLAGIDRSTAIGRRDYAILLLLARLGLRSSEVVFLELDDIDWTVGKLRIRAKGGQRLELPLPADVGKAIAAYLRHGRPQSASRRVFLRAKAPLRGLQGPCGLGSIVRCHLMRTGVDAPTYGAHQFRHGLATRMLRQGCSLGEIGELLGHHSLEATRIYTKVHLDALRKLALPWPGGAR